MKRYLESVSDMLQMCESELEDALLATNARWKLNLLINFREGVKGIRNEINALLRDL